MDTFILTVNDGDTYPILVDVINYDGSIIDVNVIESTSDLIDVTVLTPTIELVEVLVTEETLDPITVDITESTPGSVLVNLTEILPEPVEVAVTVLTGPEGPQGVPGPTGPQGPTGPIGAGGVQGIYGSFFDTTIQPILTINTPQVVTIDSEYGSFGVSILDNSKIVLETAGTYTLSFVAQVSSMANEVEDALFWIRVNGIDYPNSSTILNLTPRKNATTASSQLLTVVFTGTAINDEDYVELWWKSTSNEVSLKAFPIDTIPETPSIIVSVTQVIYTQEGPIGPTGPQGPSGINSAWVLIGSENDVTGVQTITVPTEATRVRVSWRGSANVTSQLRLRLNNNATTGLYSNSRTISTPNNTVSSSADGASDTKYLVGDFLGTLMAWGTFEIDLTSVRAPVQALAYRQGIPSGSSKMEVWGWLNSDLAPITSFTLYPSSGNFNSFYWQAEALVV